MNRLLDGLVLIAYYLVLAIMVGMVGVFFAVSLHEWGLL